jgi:hypothetical protein
MIYIGYIITTYEAARLLKLHPSYVESHYHSKCIKKHLQDNKSQLLFNYIDKGACVLGIPIDTVDEFWDPIHTDTFILYIQKAKKLFQEEIKKLAIDTREVYFTRMEGDDYLVENPEPVIVQA